ncbi:MAG: DUF4831 family protein [Candidatus Cryptobacteroides sp.]
MKRYLTIAVACLLAGAANAQENNAAVLEGAVSYSLPSTVLSFDVEAEKTEFYAGPYAKYAQKYLGIEVGQKNEVTYKLTSVRMTPYLEPDNSSRYALESGVALADAAFLQMTSCGLVCCSPWNSGPQPEWRFPSLCGGDFSRDGMTSNVSSVSEVLYGQAKDGSAYDRVAVQQEVTVAKTVDKKASETASMIFSLRKKRIQIITGDTDASYTGEAMGAALAEITRLENEYMTLFTGYSRTSVQKKRFDIIPQKDKNMYIAFRLSDTEGLVSADNISGKPLVLELTPEPVVLPQTDEGKKGRKTPKNMVYATCRIPSVCSVRLLDGADVIFSARQPVSQLGVEYVFPLAAKPSEK